MSMDEFSDLAQEVKQQLNSFILSISTLKENELKQMTQPNEKTEDLTQNMEAECYTGHIQVKPVDSLGRFHYTVVLNDNEAKRYDEFSKDAPNLNKCRTDSTVLRITLVSGAKKYPLFDAVALSRDSNSFDVFTNRCTKFKFSIGQVYPCIVTFKHFQPWSLPIDVATIVLNRIKNCLPGSHDVLYHIYCTPPGSKNIWTSYIDTRPLNEILSRNAQQAFSHPSSRTSPPTPNPEESCQNNSNVRWDSWILDDLNYIRHYTPLLNDKQREAVILALRSTKISCIRGPPGTGKTTTLVSLLKLLNDKDTLILVSCSSNQATDTIFNAVSNAGIPCVNIKPSLVRKTEFSRQNIVQDYGSPAEKNVKNGVGVAPTINSSSPLASKSWANLTKDIGHISILFATTSFTWFSFYVASFLAKKKKKCFDYVILDEASQSSQVDSWVPILLGNRIVLAGDEKQLGPTVPLIDHPFFKESLFEKLIDQWGDSISFRLSIQYRMNYVIQKWSSTHFYNGQLVPHLSNESISIADIISKTAKTYPVSYKAMVWIDTSDCKDPFESTAPYTSSLYNKYEGYLCVQLIKHYLQFLKSPAASHLCVILPYTGQVDFVQQLMKVSKGLQLMCDKKGALFGQKTLDEKDIPRISTVDSFQGYESDIVLLSLVRCNLEQSLGFLTQYQRINVAITRAKRQVLIVGNSQMILSDEILGSLFKTVQTFGHVIPSRFLFKSFRKEKKKKKKS